MHRFLLVILLLSATVFCCVHARHGSRLRPENLSPECEEVGIPGSGPRGRSSRLRPGESAACRTCCSRCYIAHFNSTIRIDDCFPEVGCNQCGSECQVSVFLRTHPCDDCRRNCNFTHTTEESCSESTPVTWHTAHSKCEIEEYDVCVGPDQFFVREMFEYDCTGDPQYKMQAREGSCENIEVNDCCGATKGSRAKFVFNEYAGTHSWPDHCFWDKHFREEIESPCQCNESNFKVYCPPNGGDVWMSNTLEVAWDPVPCHVMEKKRDETCSVCPIPVPV